MEQKMMPCKLYEDFLGEGVAETEDVADNNGYADYYKETPATHGDFRLWLGQLIHRWREFFWISGILIILFDRKFFKIWQPNTSEVNLNLYSEHMPEERITG